MFPKRLKKLRKENRYSQEYMAEQLNVSRQSYSRYENGDSQPEFSTLIRIADIFNVSLDYLLCRTDSKHNISVMHKYNQDLYIELLDVISKYEFNKK